jgi:hypothetical protein
MEAKTNVSTFPHRIDCHVHGVHAGCDGAVSAAGQLQTRCTAKAAKREEPRAAKTCFPVLRKVQSLRLRAGRGSMLHDAKRLYVRDAPIVT